MEDVFQRQRELDEQAEAEDLKAGGQAYTTGHDCGWAGVYAPGSTTDRSCSATGDVQGHTSCRYASKCYIRGVETG